MKKSTQSILVLLLFIVIILAGAFVSINRGNNIGPKKFNDNFYNFFDYGNIKEENYKNGNASVSYKGIQDINVNWPTGKIQISSHKGNQIKFQESSNGKLVEDSNVIYAVESDTLTIQFKKDSFSGFFEDFDGKDLIILIPEKAVIDEMNINGISSDITLTSIKGNSLKVNAVSGNLEITDTNFKDMELDGISGEIKAEFLMLPEILDISSVSGNIKLSLPENPGFNVEYKTVSGSFNSDFTLENKEKNHIYKNGSADIEISTVSGNLDVKNRIL